MGEIMASLDDWGGWLVAVVAGLGALGWLCRKLYNLARMLTEVHELATYELRSNGGTSVKDVVAKIPRLEHDLRVHIKQSRNRYTRTTGEVQEIRAQLASQAETIAHLAEALPVIARSTPPDDNTGVPT